MLNRLTHPGQDHHDSLLFVYYLQYQLHRQLLAVSNYAEGQRVALKGDLPIGALLSSYHYRTSFLTALWWTSLQPRLIKS